MANYNGITQMSGGLRLGGTPTASMPSPPKWRHPKRVARKRSSARSDVSSDKTLMDLMEAENSQRGLERSNAEYDNKEARKLKESLIKEEQARSQNRRYDMAYGRDAESVASRERMRNEADEVRESDFKRKTLHMADFADQLTMSPADKDGMIRITDEAVGKLPGILPDFQPIRWDAKEGEPVPIQLFGKIEDQDGKKVLSFYQGDGPDAELTRVSNRGRPVIMPLGVLNEFSKLGNKWRELGVIGSSKSEKPPAQVQLTEYIKANQGDPVWQQAWRSAQSGKTSIDDAVARYYTELTKENAKQYEDQRQSNEQIQNQVKAFRDFMYNSQQSDGATAQPTAQAGLTNPAAMTQAEKEIRHDMGWKDYVPFVEPDPAKIRMRANEIQGAGPQTGLQAPPQSVEQQQPRPAHPAAQQQQPDALIQKAASAIQRGADPAAVRQRLLERGYTEQQLKQAGL